jgi:hypothetical protein
VPIAPAVGDDRRDGLLDGVAAAVDREHCSALCGEQPGAGAADAAAGAGDDRSLAFEPAPSGWLTRFLPHPAPPAR